MKYINTLLEVLELEGMNVDRATIREDDLMGCPMALVPNAENVEDIEVPCNALDLYKEEYGLSICVEHPLDPDYGFDIHVYVCDEPVASASDQSLLESLNFIHQYLDRY